MSLGGSKSQVKKQSERLLAKTLSSAPAPWFNSPVGHPPAVTLSALHAPRKLVQGAFQTHELRHDLRQDHRDVAAGLALIFR